MSIYEKAGVGGPACASPEKCLAVGIFCGLIAVGAFLGWLIYG